MNNIYKYIILILTAISSSAYSYVGESVIVNNKELLKYVEETINSSVVIKNIDSKRTLALKDKYKSNLSTKFINLKEKKNKFEKSNNKTLSFNIPKDNNLTTSNLHEYSLELSEDINLDNTMIKPIGFYSIVNDDIEYSMLAVRVSGPNFDKNKNLSFKIAERKISREDEMVE